MAAASATMGSYGATTSLFGSSKGHSTNIYLLPRRQQPMRVRCQAEQIPPLPEQLTPDTPPPPPPPAAPKVPKVSTKFNDVLAFSGPAPERINGRLAMVGFVSVLAVEASRGNGLFAQLSDGPGLTCFFGTAALLSVASLVPLFKGVDVQSRSDGLMTANAEMWNGRFAMLGLVALAFTEYVTGSPLV